MYSLYVGYIVINPSDNYYSMTEQSKRMILEAKIKKDMKLNLKYEIIGQIGSGCFGSIFKAININSKKYVAIKIEVVDKNQQNSCTLANQIRILELLKDTPGVPQIYSQGRWSHGLYIEMELLVSSLHEEKTKQFTYPEIRNIGVELLQILKRIHIKGVIHQDLKPQNIMRNRNGNLVLIDYGLSAIMSSNKQGHSKKKGFIGTPRYASLASHKGIAQIPKDDIESMLYVIGTLYLKKAPWFQLKGPISERLQMIQKYKKLSNKDWFKKCGKHFYQIYQHLQQLNHKQWPNYLFLINLFKNHRQSVSINTPSPNNTIIPKQRRKSDGGNDIIDFPIIRIHYAKRQSENIVSKRNLQFEDKIDISCDNGSFSQIAQSGLQMMQLLTEKLLKIDEQTQDTETTAFIEEEPTINKLDKYASNHFKNPFQV